MAAGFVRRAMFGDEDDDRVQRPEQLLLAFVRAARGEADPAGRSRRQVVRASRRRRRRSAAVSSLTGPLAPVTMQIVELFAEARTVCDLDHAHGLGLSDELIAAHMLVLWSVTDDLDGAHAALEGRGERTLTAMLSERLAQQALGALPEPLTKRALVATLWKLRRQAGALRERGTRVVGTVVAPGRGAKAFIGRAELQLGVTATRGGWG